MNSRALVCTTDSDVPVKEIARILQLDDDYVKPKYLCKTF